MTEPYRYRPQNEQVKYLAKSAYQTPQSGTALTVTKRGEKISPALAAALSPTRTGAASGGLSNIMDPKNLLILLGTLLLLLFLFFLGQKNLKRKLTSTVEAISQNLRQLNQQQQVLLKAQQNQLELSQTNSLRTDELRQLFNQDLRQTLAMLAPHPVALTTTPAAQSAQAMPGGTTTTQGIPKFTALSIPAIPTIPGTAMPSADEQLPCQDDGSGACLEFKRRQSAVPVEVLTQTIAPPSSGTASSYGQGVLPKLLSAMPSFSGARARSFT